MARRPSIIVFNGIKFRRYPKADDVSARLYYRPHIGDRLRGVKCLHQEIWMAANGPIPEGHHIHHINRNPLDNRLENLTCIPAEVHQRSHPYSRKRLREQRKWMSVIRRKASLWHQSDEGRRWHSEMSKEAWTRKAKRDMLCRQCGLPYQTKYSAKSYYCSKKCKAAARRASGVDNIIRKCEWCDGEFSSNKYSGARFCSMSCVAYAREERLKRAK